MIFIQRRLTFIKRNPRKKLSAIGNAKVNFMLTRVSVPAPPCENRSAN